MNNCTFGSLLLLQYLRFPPNCNEISKILAETDIVKNSIADPIASEKKINEEVIKMFSGINAATK